ncbi:MAG: type II secretion system F family protein [Fimbriimonas sp.]
MPFFQYSATDKAGRQVNGTLQAASPDAAVQALRGAGLTTVDIRAPKKQIALAQTPRTATPVPPPSRIAEPSTRAPIQRPRPQFHPITVAAAQQETVKTRPGSDKDLYFLLTQLGDFYRTGISPSQALMHLADRSPDLYRQSLKYASAKVGEGGSLADALAKYPNLYPEHVIGCIRAGEAAGFVPDAVSRMAATVLSARRIGVKTLIFFLMAASMAVITPLSLGVINGSLDSIKAQDAAGGSLPVAGTISFAIAQQMKLMAPLALLIAAAFWAFLWYWKQAPLRRLRHSLGLTPPLRRRAQTEAMQWVSWSLSMATRAGLNHQAAYLLALQSIPNLHLRERAVKEAMQAKENEPLSIAIGRSTLLPPEYADIVHNGELAGNVPGALENIGNAAQADFEGSDRSASAILMVVLYIPLGLLTLILAAYLMTSWYKGIVDWGLKDSMSCFWHDF